MKRPNFLQLCGLAALLTVVVYAVWFGRLWLAVWEALAEGWRNRGSR